MPIWLLLLAAEQWGLPLALAASLLAVTEASLLAWSAKAGLLLAVLPHILLTGRWTPGWTVMVPWLAATAIPLDLLVFGPPETVYPEALWPIGADPWTWAAILGSTAAWTAILYLLVRLVPVLSGLRPPPGAPVRLAAPLGPGHYLVVGGGRTMAMNRHMATLRKPQLRRARGQAYAVDILGLNARGLTAPWLFSRDPTRYAIFGTTVLAPCDGEVVSAVDGLPDQSPPDSDSENPLGNHIWLRRGNVLILLAHLHCGSVRVAAQTVVRQGTPLAQVGNSGQTSEPHLHIHAQRPGLRRYPMAARPIPMVFKGLGALCHNARFTIPASPERTPARHPRGSAVLAWLRSRSRPLP